MVSGFAGNSALRRETAYWLCLLPPEGISVQRMLTQLPPLEGQSWETSGECAFAHLPANWENTWKILAAALPGDLSGGMKAALLANRERPSTDEIGLSAQPTATLTHFAEHFWLVDCLDDITCHYQKIIDRQQAIFGYEAFARIEKADGETIGGGPIIAASEALNIKHIIDRILMVKAVEGFTKANAPGCLFLNFIPGFIQKPEKYLESLEDALREHQLLPRRIALDVSKVEQIDGLGQIERVAEYCRTKGFLFSLDDITTIEAGERLLRDLTPDILKLDRHLCEQADKPSTRFGIQTLATLAHEKNCLILAEGIEDTKTLEVLTTSSVDLFQGYLIGRPERV